MILDMFNFILQSFNNFYTGQEILMITLVQHQYIIALSLLELLIDKHAVHEQSSITQFSRISPIHHMNECMKIDIILLMENLVLWNTISTEVNHLVALARRWHLERSMIVIDRWYSLEYLPSIQTHEQLSFTWISLTYQRNNILATRFLLPQKQVQQSSKDNHSNDNRNNRAHSGRLLYTR